LKAGTLESPRTWNLGYESGQLGPKMHDPKYIALLDIFVAAMVIADLRRVLATGRARVWLGGTVTRDHQPGPYWRYVYGGYAMLAFCALAFAWTILWPDSLR